MSSFVEDKKKEDYNVEYVVTLNHIMERVWYVLRDASISTSLFPNKCCPLIVRPGSNTWTVNNEFYGKVPIFGDFIGKCIKVESFPQMKQIKWELRPKNKKYLPFTFKYKLFKITQKESTVFLMKIHFISSDSYQNFLNDKIQIDKIWEEYTSNINKILNASPLNLFQFEAGVISSSMNDIWGFFTDLSQLKKIAPLIPLECDGPNNNLASPPGTIIKMSMNNGQNYFYVKTVRHFNRPNWNKWILVFDVFGGEPSVPYQTCMINITKINYEECQISNLHDFKEPATMEYMKYLSDTKKYIIASVKDYLENYN